MINPEDFPQAWKQALAPDQTPQILVQALCAYHGLELQPRAAAAEELAIPEPVRPVVYACPDPDCPVQIHIEVRTLPDGVGAALDLGPGER